MMFCAANMPPLSSGDLRRLFKNLDRNGDGLVSLDELNWLLERTGVAQPIGFRDLESVAGKSALNFADFSCFYESMSKGGGGEEGETAISKEEEEGEEGDLEEAFRVFDLNGDGFISCEELQRVLARLELWEENCGRDCKTMIGAYDLNSDGLLDFDEFKTMMMLSIA